MVKDKALTFFFFYSHALPLLVKADGVYVIVGLSCGSERSANLCVSLLSVLISSDSQRASTFPNESSCGFLCTGCKCDHIAGDHRGGCEIQLFV